MDFKKNKIPDDVKTIHLTAVCGTGMGALACMLKDMGFKVTGSDHKIYPPVSDFLFEKGINILENFHGNNLSYKPDLVIIGNAVTKNNPEAVKADAMGLYFCSMPQALNRFVIKNKKSILVTGTHGKTTTSSLMAWLLFCAGLDPGFMIGGILNNFNSNYRLGNGSHIVIEGDEYDTAFFDKGPKFLHYTPLITILTGIEFDHADIFKDINHVESVFDQLISDLPTDSTLIAFSEDKKVMKLLDRAKCRTLTYGIQQHSFWRMGNITVDPPWSIFDVYRNGKLFSCFKTRLMGEHNIMNALSVIASADNLRIPREITAKALETFKSVKRRQEVRGRKKGITVMDDFAHHPTAVRETIKGVKPFFQDGRIIAVFEPRTNTSMRDVFQDTYTDSFEMADIVCIRKPPLLDKIPKDERFSSEKLAADLKKKGKNAFYFPDTQAIIDFLVNEARANDLILIMSNGSFDNIHEKLLASL
ncbi:MAG: UDP-N-acetylmuramate:L-alanyl-gamma-D-glutamyl-meso-diaminopimelate ligase [Deltaproteobacteria bacterium]|nr:UDP-N-acetylmuramate:L-alanyl-gamma-D-glutamyl-meso-diaminopimelate ligase [Deltaproteobacteria bacterium]